MVECLELEGAQMEDSKLTLSGHLGADPELRYTPSGVLIVVLRLVATEAGQRTGIRNERRTRYRCVVAGPNAETARGLKQGARVLIEGTPRTRTWKDRFGKTIGVDEITVDSIYVPGATSVTADPLVARARSPLEAARAAGLFGNESQP